MRKREEVQGKMVRGRGRRRGGKGGEGGREEERGNTNMYQ